MYKGILSSIIYLLISNFGVRIITAVVAVLTARYLGSSLYGLLSVGLSLSATLAYATDLGTTQTAIRDSTKPNVSIQNLYSALLVFRILVGTLISLVAVIIIFYLYPVEARGSLLLIVIPSVIGSSLEGFGNIYLTSSNKFRLLSLTRGTVGLLTAGGLVACLALHARFPIIAFAYGISSLILGIINVWWVKRSVKLSINFDFPFLKDLWPFFLGGLVVMLLPQMGPLLLQRVTSLSQVGVFTIANKIPSLLYQVPGTIALVFYPMLFRLNQVGEQSGFRDLIKLQLKLMGAIGMMMSLPVAIGAKFIASILVHHSWGNDVPLALEIMSLVITLQPINYALADGLTTSGRQASRTKVLIITVVLSIISYLCFGRLWGGLGGALSVVTVELVSLIGFVRLTEGGLELLIGGTGVYFLVYFVLFGIGISTRGLFGNITSAFIFSLLFASSILVIDSEIRVFLRSKLRRTRRTTNSISD